MLMFLMFLMFLMIVMGMVVMMMIGMMMVMRASWLRAQEGFHSMLHALSVCSARNDATSHHLSIFPNKSSTHLHS